MHGVALGDGNQGVLVIRIPRSHSLPHVVDFDGHWRFYGRNSAGAFQLDVEQLRTAFLAGDVESQRTREFRVSRISSLLAGELPVPLTSTDILVAHLIPASAWDPEKRVPSLHMRRALERELHPLGAQGTTHRFNLDGLLIYTPPNQKGEVFAYLQIFGSGVVETAVSGLTHRRDVLGLSTEAVELWLWEAVPQYLDFLSADLEVDYPVVLMISLLGAEGARLITKDSFWWHEGHPIDRPNLLLPEVLIQQPDSPKAEYLGPVYDAVWNAGGYPRCPHIREDDGKLDLGQP
jgi:hypothetical protein